MIEYIGLTGKLGGGKGVVKEMLVSKLGIKCYGFGDLVREEAKKRGIKQNRKNLIELGNQLRKKHGNGVLAKKILEKADQGGILEGIRNPGEVKVLRENLGKKFILVAVDAPKKVRFKRLVERRRAGDLKDFEKFDRIDQIENGADEPSYGQRVKECIKIADRTIVNDGTLGELEEKVDRLVGWIKSL